MVSVAFNLVCKPRQHVHTAQMLRELCHLIYNNGGLIRKLSNEGIMRPYRKFRDVNNEVITYARYVQIQLDYPDDEVESLFKTIRSHPDVFTAVHIRAEKCDFSLLQTECDTEKREKFALIAFSKLEEEINWPPQVSADVYENLDKTWNEFSRTRWSNYLRM